MWLLLRKPSAHAAIDFQPGTRVWQESKAARIIIELPDGEFVIDFESEAQAAKAAASILDALADAAGSLDSNRAGWGEFSCEWTWYEPHDGVVHYPSRPEPDDRRLDEEENDYLIDEPEEWGSSPPKDAALRELWREWGGRSWLHRQRADTEDFILKACTGRYLSMLEIASLIRRSPDSVRVHHVNPMVHEGKLTKEFPGRRHPKQRYTASSDG